MYIKIYHMQLQGIQRNLCNNKRISESLQRKLHTYVLYIGTYLYTSIHSYMYTHTYKHYHIHTNITVVFPYFAAARSLFYAPFWFALFPTQLRRHCALFYTSPLVCFFVTRWPRLASKYFQSLILCMLCHAAVLPLRQLRILCFMFCQLAAALAGVFCMLLNEFFNWATNYVHMCVDTRIIYTHIYT